MKAGKPTVQSVVYVGSFLTVHNALFFLHKFFYFYWSSMFKMLLRNAIEHCAQSGPNKLTRQRSLTGFITIPL